MESVDPPSTLSPPFPVSLPLCLSRVFCSLSPDYSLPGDSLMSTFIYSFIYSFTGKIFESLITADLTDSSPPFTFTLLPKAFLSGIHFLVYISPLKSFKSLLSSTRFFPFTKKKGDLCFQRTLLCLFFTKASDSQRFHSNLKKKKVKGE